MQTRIAMNNLIDMSGSSYIKFVKKNRRVVSSALNCTFQISFTLLRFETGAFRTSKFKQSQIL